MQLKVATDAEHHTIRTVNIVAHAFARQLLTVDCDAGCVEPMKHHRCWPFCDTAPAITHDGD